MAPQGEKTADDLASSIAAQSTCACAYPSRQFSCEKAVMYRTAVSVCSGIQKVCVMAFLGAIDPGRFERPPMVRGVGKPDWKSEFTLAHPQGTPTREVSLAQKTSARLRRSTHAVKKEVHDDDKAAGYTIPTHIPANKCHTGLISHHEHPPLPQKPLTPRAIAMMRNKYFIRELDATVQEDGLVGRAAITAAIKTCFGTESPRRPPSAPPQMLVGKPPPPLVPEVNGPCNPPMPPQPSAPSSYTASSSTKGVHSRYVAAADRAVKRSQSHDYVRANRDKACSTPRTHTARMREQRDREIELQRLRRGLPPSNAAWKLSKFKAVESRLHKEKAPAVPIS